MKKIRLILIALTAPVLILAQQKIEVGDLKGTGYFLQQPWGNTYYEVFGTGEPLLILHGNGGSAKYKRHTVKEFVNNYQVITIDSRCHGQSSCPDGDLDYFELAEDVYQVMNHLGHEKYAIWGHSDGGILGLILGYTHTDNIDRMLLSGANAQLQGLEPEIVGIMEKMDEIKNPMMRKHIKLMLDQRPIPMEELEKVNVPVMLMVGDRDAVTLEHTLEIFNHLPQAQLCVLPGTTHFIENERKEKIVYWFNELKKPFSTPSTVEIAKRMFKSLSEDN